MKDQSDRDVKTHVSKRHVFFVPGYDPVGPRRYRELYRTHSRQQAEISGYQINMMGCPGEAVYAWDVVADIEGAQTKTRVEVLSWATLYAIR